MFPGDVLRNPAELSAAGKVRCKNPEKCKEKRIGAEWKGEGKMFIDLQIGLLQSVRQK